MGEQDTRKTDDRDAGQDAKPSASRPRKKTSRLAIAAFVLGAAGLLAFLGIMALPRPVFMGSPFVLGVLLAIPGFVVGLIATVRIRRRGGHLSGRDDLATAGIALALITAVMLPYLSPAHIHRGPPSPKLRCRSNLRAIAQAVQTWSDEYGEEGAYYPPSMRALYDDGVIEDTRAFICPASDADHQPGEIASDYECLLDIVGERIPARLVDESFVPLAWDNPADRHDGIMVVYFDLYVKFIDGDDALEQVHREVEEWLRTYEAAKQAEAEAEDEQAEESP